MYCRRFKDCSMKLQQLLKKYQVCIVLMAIVLLQPARAEPVSLASINLCADQLLLLLADENQIRSLSNLSHEEAGSFFYIRARKFPVNEGHAEQILNLQPDIVIVGQYSNSHTVEMLREVGLTVRTLPIADTVEAVLANIVQVAEWVGKKERGDNIVAGLRDRLALIQPPQEPRPVVAVFDPNG